MRPPMLTAAAALAALTAAAPAQAAPPAACQNLLNITDPAGDGHHPNTDLVAGWFSEQAGVQAVLRPNVPSWSPAHDDTEAAGFAMLFDVGGAWRYVRAEAPRGGALRFDHGTWTGTHFASAGPTTGRVDSGTVVIDVPGVGAGTKLGRPFALTYDGIEPTGPHWVDRAPGGVTPAGDAFGADLVVGACGLGAGGGTALPGGGTLPGGGGGATGSTGSVGTVQLKARTRITGSTTLRVTGTVIPAREGVRVSLRAKAGRRKAFARATTRADGTFRSSFRIKETTDLRATAEGLSSQTITVTVRSKVRIKVRRTRSGGVVVTGQVWPSLPGRVLWLRDGASRSSAKATVRKGRFRLRFTRPTRGRYQAVFIPSGRRAERSTSNTGVIR